FVACGDKDDGNDAQLAQKGLATVIQLTESIPEETPASYQVIGKTNAGGKSYNVKWSVTSEFPSYETYVSVGDKDATNGKVTINITKAKEVVEYNLTATVTVGKASKSETFKHKIPAGIADENQKEVSINFGSENRAERKVFTATEQVWEQNGIKLTNNNTTFNDNQPGSSASDVRLYVGSKVKIEYPAMSTIVFHTTGYEYPQNLKTILDATGLGTATLEVLEEGSSKQYVTDVTFVLNAPANELEFTVTPKQVRLASIDIVANNAPVSDEDKVNAAQSALNLATTSYMKVGTYDLPAKQGEVDVTWAVRGTSANVAIEGGKLKVNTLPAEGAEAVSVTLTATLKLNDVTKTKDVTISLVNAGIENDGTEAHPYTAAEAWKVANLLKADTAEEFYVKGFVALPGEYAGDTYNNFNNMYITDSYDASKTYSSADYTKGEYIGLFYIYRPKAQGDYLTKDGLNAGDEVTFKGKLGNYGGNSPQLAQGGICVNRVEPDRTDVEDSLMAVKSTLTVTTAGAYTLPTSTISGVTFTWSTTDTTYTVTDNKLNVATLPETPATVTLTVSATDGTETKTKTVTVTVKAPTNYGSETAPLTVAAAVAIADAECATKDLVSAEVVWMTGIVADVTAATNGFYNYTIRDAADASKTILVYTKPENVRTGVVAPAQNDVVVVSGYIKNYNGTKEFASNKPAGATESRYVYFEKNTRGTSTLTVEAGAGATVTGLSETATNGTEATFTITMAEGKELVSVKVNSTAITADAEGNYKFTVAGNMKVEIETKGEGEAAVEKLKTITFNSTNNSAGVQSYTGTFNATQDGLTWKVDNFNNNNNGWAFIKTGNKSSASVGTISTTSAVASTVTKVIVTIDSVTTASVNSFKLLIADDAAFTDAIEVTATIAKGDITFTVPASAVGANKYYRIAVDCAKGSGNGLVWISKVELWGTEATTASTAETSAIEMPEAIVDEQ
ncbi:MAG: hypothetical protein K2F90_06615, partial [Clostridiales bacterium]|nr:hypothetical protein [Clostridiales bacterium]